MKVTVQKIVVIDNSRLQDMIMHTLMRAIADYQYIIVVSVFLHRVKDIFLL